MTRTGILALILVGLGGAGALALRQQRVQAATVAAATAKVATPAATGARLVELGSTSCTSCKAMHEELAQLRQECGASIAVQEIDVWKDEQAGARFGVHSIPTQVFLDASGREFDRHTGFLARAEIRQRFAQRGLDCRR